MNEEYIKTLYDWLVSQDNEFGNVSLQDFSEGLKNETYVKEIHDYLSQKDNSFVPLDEFSAGLKSTQQPITQQTTQQPTVQEQPVKKKEDWESSWWSGDGTSESEPSETDLDYRDAFRAYSNKLLKPETKPSGTTTPPQQEQVEPKKRPEEAYSGTWQKRAKQEQPLVEPLSDYMQVYNPKKGEGVIAPTKPLDFVGRMTPELVKERTPKFIEEGLDALTPKQLASYGAKGAKETFEYYFKDAGFKFETDREYVKATSPDGKVYTYNTLYPSSEALDEFKNFVRESAFNSPQIAEKAYLYEKENKKFKTKEEISNELKAINAQEEQFMGDYKKFLNLKRDIDEIEADLKRWRDNGEQNTAKYIQTEAYLNERKKEYSDYASTADSKIADLKAQQVQLDKAVGKYTEFQATQGDFGGTLYRAVAETSAGIFSNYLRIATSKSIDILPISYLMGAESYQAEIDMRLKEKGYSGEKVVPKSVLDEIDSEIRNDYKIAARTGEYKGEKLNNVLTIDGVRESLSEFLTAPITSTSEYKQKREEEGGFVERGLIGLAGSLPAMVGGKYLRYMNMFMMTTDAAMKEMDNDPSFAGISENEKELVALPIGVVGAALEEIGFRGLVNGKAITSSIVKTVLGRVPAGASASLIRKTTFDVIAEKGIRGTSALIGATLSEAETGAAQQVNEYFVKDIYNEMKGKKMFDNPAFLSSQYLYDVYDAARTEAVGGFVMGVPYSIAAANKKDGFQALDDATFKIFEDLTKDDNGRKFFVTSLKNKINQGEVTPTQGKQMIEAYDQASGMIGSVPDEIIDVNDRKIAMDLMAERKKLENKKEGKDPALVKPIQAKIDQINEQLNTLTENAIQKQAAGEVSVQPETGVGKEMEAGGAEAGSQAAPKQGLSPEESKRKEALIEAFENPSELESFTEGVPTPLIKVNDAYEDKAGAKAELDVLLQKEQAVPEAQKQAPLTPEESQRKENLIKALEAVAGRDVTEGVLVDRYNSDISDLMRIEDAQAELDALLQKEQATPEGLGAQLEIAEKEGQETAQQTTTDIFTAAPTKTKQAIVFTSPSGIMVSLDGNEQMAAQLYDEAIATPEEQRSQQQNNIVQKMQPLVTAAAPAVEVTPVAEVTPTPEQQAAPAETFTEQDRARQQELTDALAKADKRRKNITVGETVMPKADVKAELDALNQKELSSKQPVTAPTTETATVTETTPKAKSKAAKVLNFVISGIGGIGRGGFRVWKSQNYNVQEGSNEAQDNRSKQEVSELTNPTDKTRIKGRFYSVDQGDKVTYYANAQEVAFDNKFNRLTDAVNRGASVQVSVTVNKSDNVNEADIQKALLEKLTQVVEVSVDKNTFKANSQADFSGISLNEITAPTTETVPVQKLTPEQEAAELEKLFNAPRSEKPTSKAKSKKEKNLIRNTILNAAKAIAKVLPKVNIVVHETIDDYINATGDTEASSGLYVPSADGGTIHINLENSNRRTAGHEVFHAILLRGIKTDAEAQRLAKAMLNAVMKSLNQSGNNQELLGKIQEFVSNYDENIQNEESLAEIFGYLADGYPSLDAPTKNIIQRFLDRIAKLFGLKSMTDNDIIDFMNTIAKKVATGEEITESDIEAINQGASTFIFNPTTIRVLPRKQRSSVEINKNFNLSFVDKKDIIDIESLINDIANKKQKVWFWVADQLGRGFYYDTIINKEHYLDAGPSFALDPQNRSRGVIWASGAEVNLLEKNVNQSDYIFIISGSPESSKLFNKTVFDLFAKRIGDFESFKKDVLENKPTKAMREVLMAHDSWDTLREDSSTDNIKTKKIGTGRKKFLIAINESLSKPNSSTYKILENKNALLDINELRDGFYKENGFGLNDIMLVLKPTSVGGKSNHSTYENDILGEVIGVPNRIVNSFDIMPEEIKNKYKNITETQKSQVIAPYGVGIREVSGLTSRQQKVNKEADKLDQQFPSARKQKTKKELKDIIKTAIANEYSDEGIRIFLKNIGLNDADIDTLLQEEKGAGKKITVSEKTLPGYNKLMNRIAGIIGRSRKRKLPDEKIMENVINNVEANSPEYANATDQQREQIIRDIRAMFGKKEKKAPTAEKIVGKPKPKKVTVNEMTALKDQIRLEARAAREAKGDLNKKRKMLIAAINEMKKKGSISVRQAKALINRVNSVNLDNPVMVERLLTYAEKVFNDAEYADKLNKANDLQSDIKKLSRNTKKFGNLTPFAAEFAKIDPAMVENIDEYIEMASNVKEGVQGSKIVGENVIPADMVDVGKTMEYVNKMMEAQAETIRKNTAERLQELMGVDASDLTYDQMMELLNLSKDEKVDKYKEGIIRGFIDRMFNTYSTIINDMFETGIDPFSDPDNPTTVEFKESDKKIVEEFMAMDLSLLDAKEALRAADALNNFLTNKSTAGMLATLGDYNGRKNIREVVAQGKKAKQIKMYWSPILGKTYFQQIASIPAFFERLFKSYDTGRYIREMMGINSLVNHKADAVTAANKIINNYILEFSKKRPNNKNFQDISNIIERGIIGDLAKTIVGDAKQVEAEFNRRKKLIEQSIKILEEAGTKKESQMAKAMKEAYDKIAKDSKTIEEVKAKADQINVDAVQFWVDTWAKLFDQFADVALNVYNRVLDKNVNYVPDRFGFIEIAENKKKDADGFESTFFANSNSEYFYKKEAGSLMKSTPPQSLLDEDGNSTDMYVNLSFDTNNANALMDALIDIKTAADIRQIQAFKNDPNFKNVFPFGKDAIAVKERIAAMIRNIRNKRAITDKSFKEMIRKMDRIAALGTSLLLAGPTQAISQTIPVAINTIINSGGKLNLSIINNKDANKFIDESGMGIANRGSDAVTELETLNQKLEVAAKTKVGAAAQYIEKLNREYLKLYLSNFDVFVARASWITYYEKGLKKQGIKGKVDYSKEKLNKEAAQYAQDMVDRQQNISDKDLAGQFYHSDNPLKQIIVKVIMPLTTFRMNQTTRFSNDLAILISKTASTEDRKEAAVSLGGFAAEMATFRALKLYIGYYLFYSLAQFIRGEEDDEEEKKKTWDNMKKGAATSIVSDVFSPIPQTDVPIKNLFSAVLDQLQNIASIDDDDKFNIFTENKATFASDFGLLGVSIDKILKLKERIELARTGKFKDEFGNEKTISESDRALLSDPFYIGINVASVFGLNPFAPETDNVMNRITKMAKKDAMTDKQMETYEETGRDKSEAKEYSEERKTMKKEAYGGYKTLEEFEKKEPYKFDEYSAPGGKLYKYRESERLEFEEEHKDEPFRGLGEERFKKLYPKEWRKDYGPGSAYFREQNTPEKIRERAMEKREKAKREMLRKRREVQEKIRERQERYGR